MSSRNQRLAAIRRFYRYAAERNPSVMSCYQEMALIPVKKEAEHEIEFFSEKALEAILDVPDVSSKKGRRDLVFMILLYDTGARIQEMLDLCLIRCSDWKRWKNAPRPSDAENRRASA